MSVEGALSLLEEHEVKFVDLRFTDTKGKEQHVSVPTSQVDEDFFEDGKMFDGSSIAGLAGHSGVGHGLMPDPESAVLDPFTDDATLILRCDVLEPSTMAGYGRDPRSLARRAEAYLQSTGIADAAYFGPEPEFFVFDSVRWGDDMSGSFCKVDSEEASWNSGRTYEDGNIGHRPRTKGGYFPVPPVDSLQDLRSAMCLAMEEMGIVVEVHHHEVATAGQCEIGTRFAPLVRKADELQILKYCVHNVAHAFNKTATFMPKPIVGDNGTGMHVHQSLSRQGTNIFSGDKYVGLSQEALWYIGGVFKHARALNAFTNAGTNSYKRLVPGFEAPVLLAYSGMNRSASVRIPHSSPSGRRLGGPLPGFERKPLLHLRRPDDGRPRRDSEPDRSGSAPGQGPLRSPSRGGEGHPLRLRLARPGPGGARCRPRLPHRGRCVQPRPHRCLYRAEDGRGNAFSDDDAPGGVRHVLLAVGSVSHPAPAPRRERGAPSGASHCRPGAGLLHHGACYSAHRPARREFRESRIRRDILQEQKARTTLFTRRMPASCFRLMIDSG